uniref:PH domain-containing protein n=1 Tax=Macrostomum lignano TaxID=282301 RepID=A0A1I8FKV9_9PLAT
FRLRQASLQQKQRKQQLPVASAALLDQRRHSRLAFCESALPLCFYGNLIQKGDEVLAVADQPVVCLPHQCVSSIIEQTPGVLQLVLRKRPCYSQSRQGRPGGRKQRPPKFKTRLQEGRQAEAAAVAAAVSAAVTSRLILGPAGLLSSGSPADHPTSRRSLAVPVSVMSSCRSHEASSSSCSPAAAAQQPAPQPSNDQPSRNRNHSHTGGGTPNRPKPDSVARRIARPPAGAPCVRKQRGGVADHFAYRLATTRPVSAAVFAQEFRWRPAFRQAARVVPLRRVQEVDCRSPGCADCTAPLAQRSCMARTSLEDGGEQLPTRCSYPLSRTAGVGFDPSVKQLDFGGFQLSLASWRVRMLLNFERGAERGRDSAEAGQQPLAASPGLAGCRSPCGRRFAFWKANCFWLLDTRSSSRRREEHAEGLINMPHLTVTFAESERGQKYPFHIENRRCRPPFTFAADIESDRTKWVNCLALATIGYKVADNQRIAGFDPPFVAIAPSSTSAAGHSITAVAFAVDPLDSDNRPLWCRARRFAGLRLCRRDCRNLAPLRRAKFSAGAATRSAATSAAAPTPSVLATSTASSSQSESPTGVQARSSAGSVAYRPMTQILEGAIVGGVGNKRESELLRKVMRANGWKGRSRTKKQPAGTRLPVPVQPEALRPIRQLGINRFIKLGDSSGASLFLNSSTVI